MGLGRHWAHPRSRGEHHASSASVMCAAGSSPLARGTLLPMNSNAGENGLIPARAGNTTLCATPRRRYWAHPRSRGEHASSLTVSGSSEGSSPLARGTHLHTTAAILEAGLIPARAGNTSLISRLIPCARAHPRSRGEHKALARVVSDGRGSSPLARGTRVLEIR